MGVFSKLAFWKKKDDIGDIGKELGLDKELGGGMSPDLGLGMEMPHADMQSFQQQTFQQAPAMQQPATFQSYGQPYPQQPSLQDQNYINSKNLEVISSKLDALKASLDSISQRLANLEAIARGEQESSKRRYY